MRSHADKIAAGLALRLKAAPAEIMSVLLRLERVCGDFRIGIGHALTDLSPSVRARLAEAETL